MYTIGNMLVQIFNAQKARHSRVIIPFSNIKLSIAKLLSDSGFIEDVDIKKKKVKNSEFDFINVGIKYDKSGEGAISGIKFLSKPSRRVYIKSNEIKKVRSGFGIMILSTPKGILSGDEARKQKVGGEIIAEIW